eukprot:scaffold18599_cov27-Attheya_sp.AAC.4
MMTGQHILLIRVMKTRYIVLQTHVTPRIDLMYLNPRHHRSTIIITTGHDGTRLDIAFEMPGMAGFAIPSEKDPSLSSPYS